MASELLKFELIQWMAFLKCTLCVILADMGIDLRGLDALVSEQYLDGVNISTVVHQVGSNGMSQDPRINIDSHPCA